MIGSIKVRTSDITWISDNSTGGPISRFNETIAYDFTSAIPGTRPEMFQVISTRSTTGGLLVRFRIAEACASVANEESGFGPARRLLAVDGIPSVQNVTTQMRAQLTDPDSVILRGVVSSSVDSQSLTVTDPTVTVEEQESILEALGDFPIGGWIGIGAGVAVLSAVGIGCWCNSRSKRAKKDNDILKSETAVEVATPKTPAYVAGLASPSTPAKPVQPPQPVLPPNWTEQRTDAGDVYYYNTVTGVSEWVLPTK